MDEYAYEQVNNTIIEYNNALRLFYKSLENLLIAIPELTEEEEKVLNTVKKYQPLDEIVAGKEFSELEKWKKGKKALNNIYINSERIILINEEFINFLKIYRNNIDETLLSQISKGEESEENIEKYELFNGIIMEIQQQKKILRELNEDNYLSSNEKNTSYLDEKQDENIKIIKEIKDKAKKEIYRNQSLDDFVKVKDEYIKILNNATRETILLEMEMHDNS
jgi:hypothetical protein